MARAWKTAEHVLPPYILELGLKPDLVYNPRRVASTAPDCL